MPTGQLITRSDLDRELKRYATETNLARMEAKIMRTTIAMFFAGGAVIATIAVAVVRIAVG